MSLDQTPNFKRLRLPRKEDLELFGKVVQLMGVNNISILCEDGIERVCRIPGKMFKHIWIKPGDVVIVKLWDFQPIKGDVIWRFLGFQVGQLERKGVLNNLYKFTHDVVSSNNYSKNEKE
ncbi:translation initiation factor 1A [bacterium]|nr:translation initiation factor eIF-1A [Candidatus ainarchaeum sp.]MDD3975695.1 translation initiation factor eIF-1A [Candidatus ainarchaeum sp.]NCC71404.1 translation initiation factor 1A [bacterium]